MKYITELHAHSAECSECAEMTADRVALKYIRLGYDTLVLTNHFKQYEVERCGSFEKSVNTLFEAAKKAAEFAGDRLNVIPAVEVTLNRPWNDYLIYGVTREFLLEDEGIFDYSLEKLYSRTSEAGMLLIEAHPMRFGSSPMKPKYLDGYEIFNGSNPNNELALSWWQKYRDDAPIFTAGTDCHRLDQCPNAGIVTGEPIKTNDDLLRVLRSGDYGVLCEHGAVR
jgi:hypothetical protein